eukprot:gene4553-826_t
MPDTPSGRRDWYPPILDTTWSFVLWTPLFIQPEPRVGGFGCFNTNDLCAEPLLEGVELACGQSVALPMPELGSDLPQMFTQAACGVSLRPSVPYRWYKLPSVDHGMRAAIKATPSGNMPYSSAGGDFKLHVFKLTPVTVPLPSPPSPMVPSGPAANDCSLYYPGCTPELLGNQQCDEACAVLECNFDQGMCGVSSALFHPGVRGPTRRHRFCPGAQTPLVPCTRRVYPDICSGPFDASICYLANVGDGVCDPACLTDLCYQDRGGCELSDTASCEPTCIAGNDDSDDISPVHPLLIDPLVLEVSPRAGYGGSFLEVDLVPGGTYVVLATLVPGSVDADTLAVQMQLECDACLPGACGAGQCDALPNQPLSCDCDTEDSANTTSLVPFTEASCLYVPPLPMDALLCSVTGLPNVLAACGKMGLCTAPNICSCETGWTDPLCTTELRLCAVFGLGHVHQLDGYVDTSQQPLLYEPSGGPVRSVLLQTGQWTVWIEQDVCASIPSHICTGRLGITTAGTLGGPAGAQDGTGIEVRSGIPVPGEPGVISQDCVTDLFSSFFTLGQHQEGEALVQDSDPMITNQSFYADFLSIAELGLPVHRFSSTGQVWLLSSVAHREGFLFRLIDADSGQDSAWVEVRRNPYPFGSPTLYVFVHTTAQGFLHTSPASRCVNASLTPMLPEDIQQPCELEGAQLSLYAQSLDIASVCLEPDLTNACCLSFRGCEPLWSLCMYDSCFMSHDLIESRKGIDCRRAGYDYVTRATSLCNCQSGTGGLTCDQCAAGVTGSSCSLQACTLGPTGLATDSCDGGLCTAAGLCTCYAAAAEDMPPAQSFLYQGNGDVFVPCARCLEDGTAECASCHPGSALAPGIIRCVPLNSMWASQFEVLSLPGQGAQGVAEQVRLDVVAFLGMSSNLSITSENLVVHTEVVYDLTTNAKVTRFLITVLGVNVPAPMHASAVQSGFLDCVQQEPPCIEGYIQASFGNMFAVDVTLTALPSLGLVGAVTESDSAILLYIISPIIPFGLFFVSMAVLCVCICRCLIKRKSYQTGPESADATKHQATWDSSSSVSSFGHEKDNNTALLPDDYAPKVTAPADSKQPDLHIVEEIDEIPSLTDALSSENPGTAQPAPLPTANATQSAAATAPEYLNQSCGNYTATLAHCLLW